MSSSRRTVRILESLEHQSFDDDVVVCLIPMSQRTQELIDAENLPTARFSVGLGDEEDPEEPMTTVSALLLRLNSPPKVPSLGYTFGVSSSVDVPIKLKGIEKIHFRIHFDQDTGILVFSDNLKSKNYLHFENGPMRYRSIELQEKAQRVAIDTKFQIGKPGDLLHFGGFTPGSQLHQQRRRNYLGQINPQFQGVSHSLSPPENYVTCHGFEIWGHLKGSQFQLKRQKDGKIVAGKFKCMFMNSLKAEYEAIRSIKNVRPSVTHGDYH
ncbi:hypothetical protein ABW19_dt0204281 [Dactylella cylindrospora]|nr:hypothetical protein ABW19_dt0204281 [Dactylella cylindrospora]